MLNKVVITGISGFIGSNISEYLLSQNCIVYAIIRENSNLKKLEGFESKITFFHIEDTDLNLKLAELGEFSLIHCAWNGVGSELRNNWQSQIENITFFAKILSAIKTAKIKKLIFLGSQAEYGKLFSKVNEDFPLDLNSAYSVLKNTCRMMLELFASEKKMDWIWLRVFSIFGPKEDRNWLVPSLISKIKNNEIIELTKGEQVYSYMFIKDFAKIIHLILEKKVESGIYNIANSETIILKEFICILKDKINSDARLIFGALPYRENQSMIISASIDKISRQIGCFEFTDMSSALDETIYYYVNN